MRRMATNKQLEFVNKTSEVIEVNNLEEVMKIPFAYPDAEILMELLNDKVENEEIDFDNHQVLSGISVNYDYEEDSDPYIAIAVDEDIDFPETISTLETLASWLIQNVPLNEYAYIDDVKYPNIPELKWYDFSDSEFEFVNNVVYMIGYLEYNSTEQPVLQIGSNEYPIPEIYAYYFYGTIGTNRHLANGNFELINTNLLRPKEIQAYGTNTVIDVKTNLSLSSGKYLQAPYLFGQLGSANTNSNAYVKDLRADKVIASSCLSLVREHVEININEFDSDTVSINSAQIIKVAGDSGVEIYTEGELKMESDLNRIIMVLPTSDPQVEGAIWDDNGVLKISHPAP